MDPVLPVLFQCLLIKVDPHLRHLDNLKKWRLHLLEHLLQVHLEHHLQVLHLNLQGQLQNLQVHQNLLPHLQHRQMW